MKTICSEVCCTKEPFTVDKLHVMVVVALDNARG